MKICRGVLGIIFFSTLSNAMHKCCLPLAKRETQKITPMHHDEGYKKEDTLFGHTGPINAIVMSYLGVSLASGSDDKTIILWNEKDGSFQQKQILTGHEKSVTHLAGDSTLSLLCSASEDNTLILWGKNRERVMPLKDMGTKYLNEGEQFEKKVAINIPEKISLVDWLEKQQHCVVGTEPGTILLYAYTTEKEPRLDLMHTIRRQENPVPSIKDNFYGTCVLQENDEDSWCLCTTQPTGVLLRYFKQSLVALDRESSDIIVQDGNYVLSAHVQEEDDDSSHASKRVKPYGDNATLMSMVDARDNNIFATASNTGTVSFFMKNSFEKIGQLVTGNQAPRAMAMNPQGSRYAMAPEGGNSIAVYKQKPELKIKLTPELANALED